MLRNGLVLRLDIDNDSWRLAGYLNWNKPSDGRRHNQRLFDLPSPPVETNFPQPPVERRDCVAASYIDP